MAAGGAVATGTRRRRPLLAAGVLVRGLAAPVACCQRGGVVLLAACNAVTFDLRQGHDARWVAAESERLGQKVLWYTKIVSGAIHK